ncbi:MAG TPA: transposase [Bryobacteraceae bacterium]|nr:transposase [Bryobacteraceae bacterium]
MGTRRKRERQQDLWIATSDVVETPANIFYDRLNQILDEHKFDAKVERLCRKFYKQSPYGRPSMAPGVYFRSLLIGFFEGLDSERGIAWRTADSLSLRKFLGYALDEATPDHSTISRTRRLYWLETHQAVFRWVLKILDEEGLVSGRTVSIDATTLEANAALKSIVRRDNGQSYNEYLKELAKAAGIENPTREQLARLDRKRKKKGSNQEWMSPGDPDARITKMKDGRTHLAHKAEHAVDLTSGALLAMTLQPANEGDTTTIHKTLEAAQAAAGEINGQGVEELVADKGYHSGAVLTEVHEQQVRSYIPEPERGRRNWQGEGKAEEQKRTYENRRRVRGDRNKRLQKLRSEVTERSFAHLYETGGMRRVHLRKRDNILKRLLVHGAAFNLSLILRKTVGVGKPRRLQGLSLQPFMLFARIFSGLWVTSTTMDVEASSFVPQSSCGMPLAAPDSDIYQVICFGLAAGKTLTSATGC